ncbi:MAG: hypothetical protein LJE85_11120 [Gammaproteobacteria bacterium]|jgi:hypothetical protein|nr:hypothetical protein [Gammaproteobacteria bacterium]
MDQEQHDAKTLHEFLNAPKAPADLAEKLKANLEMQIQASQPSTSRSFQPEKWWYGIAAGLVIAVVVALQVKTEPELISLAYAHAQQEAHLVGAIDGGYQSWFETAGLQTPSEANRISLSKNCAIGKQKAKHLRFDLPNNGTINLFVYRDGEGLSNAIQADGMIDGQSWVAVAPREDIRLLALFDANVSQAQVTRIIQSII